MAHDVSFTIPDRPLGRADVSFEVSRNGAKLGTLKVSMGSIVWFPSGTSYGYRMKWGRFDALMQEHASQSEKR